VSGFKTEFAIGTRRPQLERRASALFLFSDPVAVSGLWELKCVFSIAKQAKKLDIIELFRLH
jgi:hypothetical protein